MQTLPLKPSTINHYISIDVIRFLCATLVTLYHLMYLTSARQGKAYYLSQGLVDFSEWDYLTHFGWIGVQVFFVISGFVITFAAQRATAEKFLQDRIVRLVPGAWICGTLSYLCYNIVFDQNPRSEYLRSIFFSPIGPWIEPVYWTLGVEVAFYMVVFIILSANKQENILKFAWVIGIISSIHAVIMLAAQVSEGAISQVHQHLSWNERIGELLLLEHGVFFAVGIFLAHLIRKENQLLSCGMYVFMFFGSIQVLSTHLFEMNRNGDSYGVIGPLLFWIGAVFFIYYFCKNMEERLIGNRRAHQFTRQIGLMTYPLYLIHLTIGCGLMSYLRRMDLGPGLSLIMAIGLCLLLSWLIANYLEPQLQKITKALIGRIKLKTGHERYDPRYETPHRLKKNKP